MARSATVSSLHVDAFCSFLISLQWYLCLTCFPLVICSRPTAPLDRTKDSDDDDLHDRDYDVAALTNNINQAFSYKIYGNEDAEEVHVPLEFIAISTNCIILDLKE